MELEEAGRSAVRAYLAAYGPATRERIHYWLGEGLSAGRKRIARWIEQIADELEVLSIEGTEAQCLAEHAEAIGSATESDAVVLLPGLDQWVLGAGTSDTSIVPAQYRAVVTRGANLALVGGRVSGTWEVDDSTIQVEWFGDRSAVPLSTVI